MKTIRILSGATGLALLAAMGSARADVTLDFNFNVAGATPQITPENPFLPTGGTVQVTSSSENVPLTVGQTTHVPLGSLSWTLDSVLGEGNFDFSRGINVTLLTSPPSPGIPGGQASSQSGLLFSSGSIYAPGVVGVNAGSTVQFDFSSSGHQYNLDVTPDANAWFAGQTGSQPLTATVHLTQLAPVPETSTVVAGAGALALLVLGAGVHSKRSVQRIG
jgi:hypothetical protein